MTAVLPAPPTHVEVLRPGDEWPADVLGLFAFAERQRIAYGSRWLMNLMTTVFADDDGVRIYVLRRQGRAVAALPVRLLRSDKEVHALANFYSPLFAPALEVDVDGAALLLLLTAARRDCPGCTAMRFAPMDPIDPLFGQMRCALEELGFKPFSYFCHGNWYEPVGDSAERYLMRRNGALRNTIKRGEKKLAALGAHIEILRDVADVSRALQAFESVYARSWKRPEPFPSFIPGLIRLCADQGWLRIGIVWLGDQAIAAQLWIVANGRAEIYKLAYAQEHKAMAPGTVLTARLMRHVIDVDRVKEVDYLIGDDAYKAQWMSQRRERWGLVAYNPWSPRGLLGWARESLARRLKPRRKVSESEPTPNSS